MTDPAILRQRRRRLSEAVGGREVLLRGHRPVPRNYLANHYPFRQDSSFLYFLGVGLPGAAATVEAGGRTTLYLPRPGPDDALWLGEQEPAGRIAAAAGADDVAWTDLLDSRAGRLTLPLADPTATPMDASPELVRAVVEIRLCHEEPEMASIRRAAAVTASAHTAAMEATRPGVTDQEVGALVDGIFALAGMVPSFGTIATCRGEVLHGTSSGRPLRAGQLMLVDAGAEEALGCAADVTRTFPVSGRFDARQAALYDVVLAAADAAIARVGPGARYLDVHLAAARVIARGLLEMGLLRGDVDGLVERGAHAVFFPHGTGHLLGMDVHDMELYGDVAGYAPGRRRSTQFGLSFLRLDRDLLPGMVVTIEPGIYLVPAILADAGLRERLGNSVDWDAATGMLPFGGIRIEDDVMVTDAGREVLTAGIPRERADVERRTGTGPSPRERMLGSSA